VFVDDQEKAPRFYTKILGFLKKTDIPIGKFKWLTGAFGGVVLGRLASAQPATR
jgi:catechol 2,3-dioxygenase-like lactoylglutathione lyase family enzyme